MSELMSYLEYRSILGHALAQPVASLLGDLLELPRPTSSKPRALLSESGHSCAVIILLIAALEDFAARYSVHVYSDRPGRFSVQSFLECEIGEIYDSLHLDEVFAVRNGIAHAHQWALRVGAAPENIDRVLDRVLPSDFGTKAFRRVVDLSTGKTRRLGLNTVPLHITRDDALAVLRASLAVVRALHDKSRGLLGFDSIFVDFNGTSVTFMHLDRHIAARGPAKRFV